MVYGHNTNYWRHTFSNNTVDGRPFGWFWNVTDTVIDGDLYGAITLAECTDVTVLGGVFSNVTVGLQMGYCTDCSLRNSFIDRQDCACQPEVVAKRSHVDRP